ncbi:MAG: hypothetical protein HW421_2735 [Ignavibacteria bacterium]|nr:hypothetical protein [Ignavibacteria bacterium]
MKNYLYKFEFFSGFYEHIFYRQVHAIDKKDAIVQVVAYFLDKDLDETDKYIAKYITEKKDIENIIHEWTVEEFWELMDMKFNDGYQGYDLIFLKEINFDLDRL